MAREADANALPEPSPLWVTRGAMLSSLLSYMLIVHWVFAYLGGPAASAEVMAGGVISTDRLFNWHALLMPLAFSVLMSEAVLAYRSPYLPKGRSPRPTRKRIHWILHSCAAVCVFFGLLAVFRSHNLKVPPTPNLYSPHSWLGLFTVSMAGLQFAAGVYSYLWPKLSLSNREALGPVHRFLGQTTYVMGLATMATGIQEKTTFVQVFGKKDVRSGFIVVPAMALVCLAVTGALVMFHFRTPAVRSAPVVSPHRQEEEERLTHNEDGDPAVEASLLGHDRALSPGV